MKFLPTKERTFVVFCDYFKIYLWSTDFKYSRLKHKLNLFVFKSIVWNNSVRLHLILHLLVKSSSKIEQELTLE